MVLELLCSYQLRVSETISHTDATGTIGITRNSKEEQGEKRGTVRGKANEKYGQSELEDRIFCE